MTTPTRKLPAGAYESLQGFKAQAAAATLMIDGDKKKGREDLRAAQKLMSDNPEWTTRIYRALMTHGGIEQADDTWLERIFEDYQL